MIVKLKEGEFYGNTVRSAALSTGIRFTEKSYQPQTYLPPHAHKLALFCFVLQGSYTEEFDKEIARRTPSTLVFYPSDAVHSQNLPSGGRHFLIELEPQRMKSFRDFGITMNRPATYTGVSNCLAARLYNEFRHMDNFSSLILESMAVELIVETFRSRDKHATSQTPKWLTEARRILQENFLNPPNLDCLSKAVGVHPVHLIRVFRKVERCTIGEYIRQIRVEHARRKILVSDESLAEIAISCGFVDQAHLARSFRRITGMTPSEFRKIVRPR